jgi:hypothetical protein
MTTPIKLRDFAYFFPEQEARGVERLALTKRLEDLATQYGGSVVSKSFELKRMHSAFAAFTLPTHFTLPNDRTILPVAEVTRALMNIAYELCFDVRLRKEDGRIAPYYRAISAWRTALDANVRHRVRQEITKVRREMSAGRLDRLPPQSDWHFDAWETDVLWLASPQTMISKLRKVGKADVYYRILSEAVFEKPAPELSPRLNPELRRATLMRRKTRISAELSDQTRARNDDND